MKVVKIMFNFFNKTKEQKKKESITLNIMGEKIDVDPDKLAKWNEDLQKNKLDKLENGELPFEWYAKNKKWINDFKQKENKLVEYAIASRQTIGQEKIDILHKMIEYYYLLKEECYSKSECHKKYFEDMLEHCHNSRNKDFEYIKPYEEELKTLKK